MYSKTSSSTMDSVSNLNHRTHSAPHIEHHVVIVQETDEEDEVVLSEGRDHYGRQHVIRVPHPSSMDPAFPNSMITLIEGRRKRTRDSNSRNTGHQVSQDMHSISTSSSIRMDCDSDLSGSSTSETLSPVQDNFKRQSDPAISTDRSAVVAWNHQIPPSLMSPESTQQSVMIARNSHPYSHSHSHSINSNSVSNEQSMSSTMDWHQPFLIPPPPPSNFRRDAWQPVSRCNAQDNSRIKNLSNSHPEEWGWYIDAE